MDDESGKVSFQQLFSFPSKSPFSKVPFDVIEKHLLPHCSNQELLALRLVCKTFLYLISRIWKPSLKQPLKIALTGDRGCGKSSLFKRFINNSFSEEYNPPSEIYDEDTKKNFKKIYDLEIEGITLKLQLWDLFLPLNNYRFRHLGTTEYLSNFRGARGIIICFDLTDRTSWDFIEKELLSEIEQFSPENVNKIMVGCKSDLIEKRVVTNEEVEKICEYYGLTYMETSAKSGENVDQAFITLATQIKKRIEEKREKAKAQKDLKKRKNSCNVM